MSAPALVPVSDIARMLAAQAPALVREVLPAGVREGHEWRVGSLGGEKGRSLAVHLDGAKAGVWADFSADKRGDALDLVAEAMFAGDKKRAIEWARRWLGLDQGDPQALAKSRARVEDRAAERAEAAADAEARRKKALGLWLAGKPALGTPVEAYLAARGIHLQAFGHVPSALRFLPECWCQEVKAKLPAMVAAIADRDGRHVATHRTWLAEVDGVWRKAPLQAPKKAIGPFVGGWIRLTRGAAGTPWREMTGEETVAFAEGIETALSVATLVPEWRTGAGVSLTHLARIVVPRVVREAVICADNDRGNEAAAAALQAAVINLQRQGVRVRLTMPADGTGDWNDALLAEISET